VIGSCHYIRRFPSDCLQEPLRTTHFVFLVTPTNAMRLPWPLYYRGARNKTSVGCDFHHQRPEMKQGQPHFEIPPPWGEVYAAFKCHERAETGPAHSLGVRPAEGSVSTLQRLTRQRELSAAVVSSTVLRRQYWVPHEHSPLAPTWGSYGGPICGPCPTESLSPHCCMMRVTTIITTIRSTTKLCID
jgi:hypothetical protein